MHSLQSLYFIIPALAFHLYAALSFEPDRDEALIIAAIMFISLWSMASGAALISLIFVQMLLEDIEQSFKQFVLRAATATSESPTHTVHNFNMKSRDSTSN